MAQATIRDRDLEDLTEQLLQRSGDLPAVRKAIDRRAKVWIARYQASADDPKLRNRRLLDPAVLAYWYLANHIARRVGDGTDDVFQVAREGLVSGLQEFDLDRGVRVSTFLGTVIVNAIWNYYYTLWQFRATDREKAKALLLRSLRSEHPGASMERLAELAAAETIDEGEVPPPELVRQWYVWLTDAAKLIDSNAATSFDAAAARTEGFTLEAKVPARGTAAAYSSAEVRVMLERAKPALDERDPNMWRVVMAHHLYGLSVTEIAEKLELDRVVVKRLLSIGERVLRAEWTAN